MWLISYLEYVAIFDSFC